MAACDDAQRAWEEANLALLDDDDDVTVQAAAEALARLDEAEDALNRHCGDERYVEAERERRHAQRDFEDAQDEEERRDALARLQRAAAQLRRHDEELLGDDEDFEYEAEDEDEEPGEHLIERLGMAFAADFDTDEDSEFGDPKLDAAKAARDRAQEAYDEAAGEEPGDSAKLARLLDELEASEDEFSRLLGCDEEYIAAERAYRAALRALDDAEGVEGIERAGRALTSAGEALRALSALSPGDIEIASIDGSELSRLFELLTSYVRSRAVLSVWLADGRTEELGIERQGERLRYGEDGEDGMIRWALLGAKLAGASSAGLVLRSWLPDQPESFELRGWQVTSDDERVRVMRLPASELKVCCSVDSQTGQTLPHEPGALFVSDAGDPAGAAQLDPDMWAPRPKPERRRRGSERSRRRRR